MKKELLAMLVAVNVLGAVALVFAVDFLGAWAKANLLSHIYELRHQGIIASDSEREIALGWFDVAEVELPEGAPDGAEAVGADFLANIRNGEASSLFRKIRVLPGCMVRWVGLLLCTNGLVFLGGWLYARRQRGSVPLSKGRTVWSALAVGVPPVLAGADLLAGAVYVPLARMVTRLECAQVADGFRELQLVGITRGPVFDGSIRVIFDSGAISVIAGCAAVLLLVDAAVNVMWSRRRFGVPECETKGK